MDVSSSVRDLFDELPLDNFENILAFFNGRDLGRLCTVSKRWNSVINQESVWRLPCKFTWQDKVYLPLKFRAMAEFGNSREARTDLKRLGVKQLKRAIQELSVKVAPGCLEKSELFNFLREQESLSLLPNEPMSKRALRLSLIDSRRVEITEDELIDQQWSFRIRGDGPLQQLAHLDPWWNNRGFGTVSFLAGPPHRLKWTWPNNEDPFEAVGWNLQQHGWDTIEDGEIVRILIQGGHSGPAEYVCRHPANWGLVLLSAASVWANFPFSPKGLDALMEDDNVNALFRSSFPRKSGSEFRSWY